MSSDLPNDDGMSDEQIDRFIEILDEVTSPKNMSEERATKFLDYLIKRVEENTEEPN